MRRDPHWGMCRCSKWKIRRVRQFCRAIQREGVRPPAKWVEDEAGGVARARGVRRFLRRKGALRARGERKRAELENKI